MTEQPPPPESPQSPQSPEPPAQAQVHAASPPPVASAGSNGMAIAALVMGILAIVFFLVPPLFPLSLVVGILGIIFGFIGRARARENPAIGGRGMALAGIITSIIGFLLALIISVLIGLVFGALVSSEGELRELDRQLDGIQQPG